MATIADFVGTWYLGGDRTKPCHIRQDGTHLTVSIRGANYQDYSFDGNNKIYRGGYPTGVLCSDLKRIDWTFVDTFWER